VEEVAAVEEAEEVAVGVAAILFPTAA